MAPSALWLFAHRALAPQFHHDPTRFVATLDGGAAPAYLEDMWRWALGAAAEVEPAQPPLSYSLERPRADLAIVRMRFRAVSRTGEPWEIRFIVRQPTPGMAGYVRMFLLEHSEYASELAGVPTAMVCEAESGGRHRNWDRTFAPTDVDGFDAFVIETIRATVTN